MSAKIKESLLVIGVLIFTLVMLVDQGKAQQCGKQVYFKFKCSEGYCCSNYGWCGTTDDYCDPYHCQSQCPKPSPPTPPPPPPPSPITDFFSEDMFEKMFLHRNYPLCSSNWFYTYYAFITAATSFPEFCNTGDVDTRKRELAAFFGQTSQATTGKPPDGPYTWGYCFIKERTTNDYCVHSDKWPCVPGKKYYGRGPIQLSYNYNYGPAGEGLNLPLLSDPDLVEKDPIIAFKAAIWFWMTPQSPKPSCHDVITGQWVPTPADTDANRLPGYGVITNIINGGIECNKQAPDPHVENRIGYYKRYCDILNVSYGENLDCYHQKPFPPNVNWGYYLSRGGLFST